jgi:hypothetical protein
MRDMLMRALGVRFGDAGYLNVGHSRLLSRMRTKLCSSPMRNAGGLSDSPGEIFVMADVRDSFPSPHRERKAGALGG